MSLTPLKEIKVSIIELAVNLLPRIQGIINILNEEKPSEAFGKLFFLLEDIGSLIEGIQYLNENNVLNIEIEEMNEKLTMLMDSIEVVDYKGIEDIFSFEIIPLLEFWMESMKNG